MTERLHTPWTHKLITSPIGILLDTRLFEWIKDRSLPREFRLARAGAAAAATVGSGPDAFLDVLGVAPDDLGDSARERLPEALANFEEDWQARADAIDAWDSAFWNGADVSADERVAREEARRDASERCVTPSGTLGFLAREDAVPPVKCDVPAPAATFDAWTDALADPATLYAAPSALPPVETSRSVPGPAGPEYLVRFDSPSPLMHDTVCARVFEPEGADDAALPTFIYGSGLGMAYDQIRYWPEEDYMGRPLAAKGYRVVLIESPWHGRRMAPGRFSGEPYLATAPVGLFTLYAAQAQETARLIAWAREHGAPVVGVGGVSLGGIVAQHVAGWSVNWPETQRPDVVFLGASSTHIDEVVLQSTITKTLGVDAAVRAAGWAPEDLRRLRPLLDPPATLGLPPERVVAVLGRRDQYVPYRWAREMLDGWGVPAANIVTWDMDHFGVLVRLYRETDAQELIRDALDRANADRRSVQADRQRTA
jgi:hypothetical protein